jgi:hypothetical protein
MRILRGLSSRLLPCGCIVGIYETYDGATVTLLDDRDAKCADPAHVNGDPIPDFIGVGPSSATQADRQRKA